MTAVSAPTRSTSYDAVTGLTAFLVLLVVIPSRLIFAPLGSAGTPAEVLGMVLFAVWLTVSVTSLGRREKRAEALGRRAGAAERGEDEPGRDGRTAPDHGPSAD